MAGLSLGVEEGIGRMSSVTVTVEAGRRDLAGVKPTTSVRLNEVDSLYYHPH